jgi:hypothetical protein
LRQGSPDFELLAPAPLNLVCFAHRGGGAARTLTGTSWNG